MSKLFTFLFLCFMTMNVFGQRAVYEGIENLKKSGRQTISFAPFEFLSNKVENREFELKGLRKGTVLHFDKKAIQTLLQQASDFIEVKIPVTDRLDLVLTLERNIIFAPDFQLFASDDPLTPLQYTPGLHYKGVINHDPSSLVALSVYEDQVISIKNNALIKNGCHIICCRHRASFRIYDIMIDLNVNAYTIIDISMLNLRL